MLYQKYAVDKVPQTAKDQFEIGYWLVVPHPIHIQRNMRQLPILNLAPPQINHFVSVSLKILLSNLALGYGTAQNP